MIRCGIDLVQVERVRAAIETHGERFLRRVFTPVEVAYCTGRPDPWPHYAARFAAKEAVYKAVPHGTLRALVWREIGVRHGPGGAPEVDLGGATRDQLQGWSFAISLSHDRTFAVAQVVAERSADV
jgi:holo-[acyl-carrier protein] synthase